MTNKIIQGDNLEIMRGMDDESVDLIVMDPPFFSQKNYMENLMIGGITSHHYVNFHYRENI